MKNLFFDWSVSDHHGWGVYGLNLLMHGARIDSPFRPVPLEWPPSLLYPLDPFSQLKLLDLIDSWGSEVRAQAGDVLLTALGNSIKKKGGTQDILEVGVTFFEQYPLLAFERAEYKEFEKIVVGSTWNEERLKELGIEVDKIIQGVDTDIFRPMTKKHFQNRFVIFSGGKLEFRKGQVILLKLFSKFCQRHRDALLITAWSSPWENTLSESVNLSSICEPFKWTGDLKSSVELWADSNEIPLDQLIQLGPVSNRLMPEVFREVDLAVFTNRCEGGTNLVAMEALASGVTCAISSNTGHLDIIGTQRCIPLVNQSKVSAYGMRTVDWGESSVDEVVSVMESVYSSPNRLEKSDISSSMTDFTWEKTIVSLYESIK